MQLRLCIVYSAKEKELKERKNVGAKGKGSKKEGSVKIC